jgi:hypothetical protein
MGVRIHVYLHHNFERMGESEEILARLEKCTGPALAVQAYWRTQGNVNGADQWVAEPLNQRLPQLRRYEGPGALYLLVAPRAALLYTGARWRGLLSIEPLRRVHVAAFRAIAQALGSDQLAICSDTGDDDVYNIFLNEEATQADCVAKLRKIYGSPHALTDLTGSDPASQLKDTRIWFLEPARLR